MVSEKLQWGAFVVPSMDNIREKHVAPVDADGFIAGDHILSSLCACNPRVELTRGGTHKRPKVVNMYIHEDTFPPIKATVN
jgi:hypothetical protein